MLLGITIIIAGCIIFLYTMVSRGNLGKKCPSCFTMVNYLTKSIAPAYTSVCETCADEECVMHCSSLQKTLRD